MDARVEPARHTFFTVPLSEPSVAELFEQFSRMKRPDQLALEDAVFSHLRNGGDARTRSERRSKVVRGPHRLASFQDVVRILGISESAAQRRITRDDFPVPAYRQRQPPGARFWRLRDLERYAAGEATRRRRGALQAAYLDRNEVAQALGLAPITVTTLSSPRIPDPAVVLGGLQLWLRRDIERVLSQRRSSRMC